MLKIKGLFRQVVPVLVLLLLASCQWPLFSPDSTTVPSSPASTITSSALTEETSYPAGSLFPTTQPGSIYTQPENPYNPPTTYVNTDSYPYPGSGTSNAQPTQPSNSAYPGQSDNTGSPGSSVYPGASPTLSVNPMPGGNESSYPAGGSQTPASSQVTATNSGYPMQPTLTPLASQQPTATPKFTYTPTSFPTSTPLQPPLWLQSELKATDPDEVVLTSGKVQLVEFFAFWCGPCQAMAPLVHGLEERYESQMNFIYLDIDDPRTKDLKALLGYKSQPHFFLLDPYGVIIEQWVGAVPIDLIEKVIIATLP